jgi:hypothetical protein
MIDRKDDPPWEEEPNEHGPINNPVDRFIHLPRPTRRWLESLREEDIRDIEEAAEFLHKTKTIGKFGKWLVITFVAIFVGMVQFGEAFVKGLTWFLGKGVK